MEREFPVFFRGPTLFSCPTSTKLMNADQGTENTEFIHNIYGARTDARKHTRAAAHHVIDIDANTHKYTCTDTSTLLVIGVIKSATQYTL